jgi:hypothetical protein
VGVYWWLGLGNDEREARWTGKHDETGAEFAASEDSGYAWSAAFISYVMRLAGAGARFPYSSRHSDYINAAVNGPGTKRHDWVVSTERLETYAPEAGDLICMGRRENSGLRFDDLPAGPFLAHCDIVVAAVPGTIGVVGGNVDDAVTMKHVPLTPEGRLATADGSVLDPRYPWFVVLRVRYDGDGPVLAAAASGPAPSAQRAFAPP